MAVVVMKVKYKPAGREPGSDRTHIPLTQHLTHKKRS